MANISRVEIVRGPGSAVHGADAFAGTINIITKDGQEIDGTSGGVRYGSFDTYDGWLQHGGTYGGWDLAFNFEFLKTDGDSDRTIDTDTQQTLDGLFGTDASLVGKGYYLNQEKDIFNINLALQLDKWTTRLWYWQGNDSGVGDDATQLLSESGNADAEQFLAEVVYSDDQLFNNMAMDVHLSYMYEKLDAFLQLFPSGAILPVGTDGNFFPANPANFLSFVEFTDGVFGEPIQKDYQYNADLTFNYTGFAGQKWRIATGVRYIKGEYGELKNFGPDTPITSLPFDLSFPPNAEIDGTLTDVTGKDGIFCEDQSRTVWFASLQDEWSFARKWELTAGVRYDHYSDFGQTINPRVALVWETTPSLTTKLLYGEAFRPPSFAELYNKNNPSNLGNSELDPETIRTLELAFDYQPVSRFRSILNLFAYDINDLIELVPDPVSGDLIAQNARDQEGYGFELEISCQLSRSFQLMGNIAYQHSEDKETGIDVPDAPQLQAYLNAHWKFYQEWFFDAQWFWIGNRERAAGDPRPDIDDYSVVNLVLRRKYIVNNWDIVLLAKNVFDEDVREPSQMAITNDYPMEGRSIYGEVRLHF